MLLQRKLKGLTIRFNHSISCHLCVHWCLISCSTTLYLHAIGVPSAVCVCVRACACVLGWGGAVKMEIERGEEGPASIRGFDLISRKCHCVSQWKGFFFHLSLHLHFLHFCSHLTFSWADCVLFDVNSEI